MDDCIEIKVQKEAELDFWKVDMYCLFCGKHSVYGDDHGCYLCTECDRSFSWDHIYIDENYEWQNGDQDDGISMNEEISRKIRLTEKKKKK